MSQNNNQQKPEEILRTSPMFQLSLSSKELFHSNFLCWLAENHKQKFFALLQKLLPKENHLNIWEVDFFNGKDYINEDDVIVVKREKDNLDFCVWRRLPALYKRPTTTKHGVQEIGWPKTDENGNQIYEYTPLLVLENKVKSIIYKEQLIRYKKKLVEKYKIDEKKVDFILLSLADVSNELGNDTGWHIISYEDLSKGLIETFLQDKSLSEASQFLIEDYCKYIGGLHNLAQEWYAETKLFGQNTVAKSLRLDDIRQKILFSHLLNVLNEELKNNGFEVLTPFTFGLSWQLANKENTEKLEGYRTDANKKNETQSPLVLTNVGFSHAQGLVELRFMLKEKFQFGKHKYYHMIQIQGGNMNVGIEFKENTELDKTDEKFKDLLENWQNLLKNSKNFKDINVNDANIGQYKPTFIYYRIPLGEYNTIKTVVQRIVEIMEEAIMQNAHIFKFKNYTGESSS